MCFRKKTWVAAGAGLGPAAVALDPRSLPTNGGHHWRISSGLASSRWVAGDTSSSHVCDVGGWAAHCWRTAMSRRS